jgi:single-strand DNA-binding protein
MIIGRLGADPDIKYTQGGSPIANLRIATDESYTDRDGNRQERTEWHTVVAFQRTAEICQQYLHKGSLVYIEGKLQTRKWQDKQGQERYTTEIQCQRLQMLERKQEAPAQQSAPQQAHEEPGWEEVPF